MKILMLSNDKNIFQPESAVAKRLVEQGSLAGTLHVISYSNRGLKETALSHKTKIFPSNSWTKVFSPLDIFRIGSKMCKKNKYQLISTQDGITGYVGYMLKKKFNIPLQVQVHTNICSPFYRKASYKNLVHLWCYKKILAHADCIRVVSNRIKENLIKEYGIDGSKIQVLSIYVDIDKIKKTKPNFDLHDKFPNFKTIFLMVGRIESEKNHLDVIIALKESRAVEKGIGLVIVGSGGLKNMLIRKVHELNMHNNVAFIDWTSDVISYYKTADLFILNSLYEGYGLVLVEAHASGVPILTTNVGLVGGVVNKRNAFIVEPGDKEGLKKTLSTITTGRGILDAMKHRAKIEIVPESKAEYLQKYKNHWRSCLGIGQDRS